VNTEQSRVDFVIIRPVLFTSESAVWWISFKLQANNLQYVPRVWSCVCTDMWSNEHEYMHGDHIASCCICILPGLHLGNAGIGFLITGRWIDRVVDVKNWMNICFFLKILVGERLVSECAILKHFGQIEQHTCDSSTLWTTMLRVYVNSLSSLWTLIVSMSDQNVVVHIFQRCRIPGWAYLAHVCALRVYLCFLFVCISILLYFLGQLSHLPYSFWR